MAISADVVSVLYVRCQGGGMLLHHVKDAMAEGERSALTPIRRRLRGHREAVMAHHCRHTGAAGTCEGTEAGVAGVPQGFI